MEALATVQEVRDFGGVPALTGDDAVVQTSVNAATDILYNLSGRRFPGWCEETIRPGRNHRRGCDLCERVTVFPLPPDTAAVTQVVLDGAVLPAVGNWRLDSGGRLVRVVSASGGVQAGWPLCQPWQEPPTGHGTFQVTRTYGAAPDAAGKLACCVLAAQITLLGTGGDGCALTANVTATSREGVSYVMFDPMDVIRLGRTGLTVPDQWLAAVNPDAGVRGGPVVGYPEMIIYPRAGG